MKKFLLSLCIFSCTSLSTIRTFAQTADSLQVAVDSLSVKVAKLEHDLTYLKIDTDIRTLDAKIEILSMKIGNILTDFQLAILTNDKREAKVLYRNLYKTYEESVELVKQELDSLQEFVNSNEDSFSAVENILLNLNVLRILSIWKSNCL